VPKLRELILQLAVQGELVEQDANDEPAAELLKRAKKEKERLFEEKSIRRQDAFTPINSQNAPFTIPSTWEWKRLGDICFLITDGTHHTPKYQSDGVPFLSVKDVSGGRIDFSDTRFITEEDHRELCKRCKPEFGDILLTKVGTTGIAITVDERREFSIFVSIALLKFSQTNFDCYYLKLLINSPFVRKQSAENTQGIGNKNLVLRLIKQFSIPIPPLAEQKRIVAKVDELMAWCDRLEAQQKVRAARGAELSRAALARFAEAPTPENLEFLFHPSYDIAPAELRKAILDLAVRGKLVPQDVKDESVSELFPTGKVSHKCEKDIEFENKCLGSLYQIPFHWAWLRVEDLFQVAGGIQKTPQRQPHDNAFPYLGVGNVYRGRLDLTTIKKFELEYGELERRRLEPGDLLIIEGNGSFNEIGRCAQWNGEIPNCVHQNHVIRCRPANAEMAPFVLLFLNSPVGVETMQRLAITSSGLYSLSVGKIRKIDIPLPPLAEQKRIVAKVDELMILVDRLEELQKARAAHGAQLMEALVAGMVSGPGFDFNPDEPQGTQL
jgi:type I restriction enzyme S subunit